MPKISAKARRAAGTKPAGSNLLDLLPKAELHLHLEGSVEPATLRELAQSKKRLARETEDWILRQERRGFRYGSFAEFLSTFKEAALLLDSPRDYALLTTRLCQRLIAQNVRYAEMTLSAGVILWKKQPLPQIFEAAAEAAQAFSDRLRVRWIFDAVRQFGVDHAHEALGWARIFRDDGVAAFGIGGDEKGGPAKLFADIYNEARAWGLHTVAHAGESDGPRSVRAAVELLGAERIGHGLAAAQDPSVMDLLARRGIPLEVCLTSNVATGLIARVEDHPLRRLLDAGARVTLNTDDPGLFSTTLENEIELARQAFGLTEDEMIAILRTAIVASFDAEANKQGLLDEFEAAACGTKRQKPV